MRLSVSIASGCFGALFALIGTQTNAWAFPEMVRHGYINCNTCHWSPSGGGVLTRYGRELSQEVLSTWGVPNSNESKFAYGLIPTPEWLDVMGLYRSVYAYQNTPFISQSKYIFMMNDLEAAANIKTWSFVGALGYVNPLNSVTAWDHLISRRHYVNYRPDENWSFRAGKFYPNYGINTADHVIATKRGLGWDEGQETYNLEAAWIGEKWSAFVTGILGNLSLPSASREPGVAVSASLAIAESYKVGVSYFHGQRSTSNRDIEGVWGILGFGRHFFLLSEWDLQEKGFASAGTSTSSATQVGMVNYQKLDYELTQGLHVYLTQDFGQLNFADSSSLSNSFGVGLQFFPRPHFELNMSWQKLRILSMGNVYTDFAWLMWNIYL